MANGEHYCEPNRGADEIEKKIIALVSERKCVENKVV